jgi:MtaA/CmuA family methyltransferase
MMQGIDLLKQAFKCEDTPRIPWVPFVGCHGGALIGINAREYLSSSENMIKGAKAAIDKYKPDGLPIAFDLQIEAEILGCDVLWADENPPAVTSHPLANGKKLSDLHVPKKNEGRLPVVLKACEELRQEFPELGLYGLITGPFTLAMHLLGTELFMKMIEDAPFVHSLLAFCRDVCLAMSDYYIEAGCDIIALVDPMTSQIGPEQFKQFIHKPASEIFHHIRKNNKLSSFFVCGHAQQNIEVMCDCKPDNISIDENISLEYVRDVCLNRKISFGGNLQLTVVLLLGDENAAKRNALDCIESAGNKGFILAPGCDLPYATPVSNLVAITRLVHDPYERQVMQTIDRQHEQIETWDMSQYGIADKVIVDIITLDSEACAPCQYMVEAVKDVIPQFKEIIEWREHKIKHPDSIQFMTSLMVKNIPTICIDGKITFVSRIPPKEELIAAIQKRIIEKLRHKIRTKKGAILILGRSAEECAQLRPVIEQASNELGVDPPIIEITEEEEILSYGVFNTPAIVIAHYKVKTENTDPTLPIVKEWIKEII